MSIVTISRGSYSHGVLVAEALARRLGYGCVSRDVLLEVSKQFNVPEYKLTRAIQCSPAFLERLTFARAKYVAYIRYAILNHLAKDNMIYHGFAGHFFVKGVTHALKVRINAGIFQRIQAMMEREGLTSEGDALRLIQAVDEERRNWSMKLYGIDTWDSRLYDLTLTIDRITVDDAVDMIVEVLQKKAFQTTPESRRHLDVLLREAEAELKRFSATRPFFEPLRESPWKKKSGTG
ncbi:MAG: cytidylate kinase-like family protein [Deltaproteobacteria bacterium]|nr:cytidylate kinase-like family protein [Deltaproteobacteria bacterium]